MTTLLGPPDVQRKLRELAQRPVNFDPDALAGASPDDAWAITDLRQELPSEAPGPPAPGGSWEIARRLMCGYEFADPSIVRAYYDPDTPFEGRNMLLKLQALRVLHLYAGVRVAAVYERTATAAGREGEARVWGWNYRTLEGHVEMGQMDWEVWKWLKDGRVEFRVHSVSRPAPIRNPVVAIGFHLLRRRERDAFLRSTKRRMLRFVELALAEDEVEQRLLDASAKETARAAPGQDIESAGRELGRRAARSTMRPERIIDAGKR